ncbi:MAG: hypothetical protein IT509_02265 [Rhodocyclaceae bacterium]|nr:hypothetical protein [Rhodocyclaceae bacterium]
MKRSYLCLLLLFVFGCSGDDPEPKTEQTRDRMVDAQREALAKAKEIDQVTQDAADRQRRAIDAQSSGADDPGKADPE